MAAVESNDVSRSRLATDMKVLLHESSALVARALANIESSICSDPSLSSWKMRVADVQQLLTALIDDIKDASPFPAGQRVRVHGLSKRPELNGKHATVLALTDAELEICRTPARSKVQTMSETLLVQHNNLSVLPTALRDSIFSDNTVVVSPTLDPGFGLFTQRRIQAGEVVYSEAPLLANIWDDALAEDPVVAPLLARVLPYAQAAQNQLGIARFPDGAMDAVAQVTDELTRRSFAQLTRAHQRRVMALCDSHSSGDKTVGGIFRSNSFSADHPLDACLYEVLSRANVRSMCLRSHHSEPSNPKSPSPSLAR